MSPILVIFIWKECGHCKNFMSEEYDELKSMIPDLKIVHYGSEAAREAKIISFPTIWFVHPDAIYSYEGKRKASDIASAFKKSF